MSCSSHMKALWANPVWRAKTMVAMKGVRRPNYPKANPKNAVRDEQICSLYKSGHTLREIAMGTGVTFQRIAQILCRSGVPMRAPGRRTKQRTVAISEAAQ
jgi:hypothetical protein